MRLCHYLFLIITCLACLQYKPSSASIATLNYIPGSIEISQATSDEIADGVLPLRPGRTGKQVKILQTQLKELGFYEGSIDGKYGGTTKSAVSKFQSAKNLSADGIVGRTTRNALKKAVEEQRLKASIDGSSQSSHLTLEEQGIFGWSLIAIGVLGSTGAMLYIAKFFSQRNEEQVRYFYPSYSENFIKPNTNQTSRSYTNRTTTRPYTNQTSRPLHELDTVAETVQEFKPPSETYFEDETLISDPEATAIPSATWLSGEQTFDTSKSSLIDGLITDLHSLDSEQRRKAIWGLGQEGDSRAIQPLTDLMVDADSQERSLILASLSEIGNRTLKPMNQALAISLQDKSPQVRQNAIRDITRVYDMMAQISQILSHAIEDEDPKVQETARYALSQMNRIRSSTNLESLESLEKLSPDLEDTQINQIQEHTSE